MREAQHHLWLLLSHPAHLSLWCHDGVWDWETERLRPLSHLVFTSNFSTLHPILMVNRNYIYYIIARSRSFLCMPTYNITACLYTHFKGLCAIKTHSTTCLYYGALQNWGAFRWCLFGPHYYILDPFCVCPSTYHSVKVSRGGGGGLCSALGWHCWQARHIDMTASVKPATW